MPKMAYAFIPEYINRDVANTQEVKDMLPGKTDDERYLIVRAILHNGVDMVIDANTNLR